MKKLIISIIPIVALALSGCSTCCKKSCSKSAHSHEHQHASGCGHTAIQHAGHTDHLHDSHLHHTHGNHSHEHAIAVTAANPATCTPGHGTDEKPAGHVHNATCGHAAIPHGDHTDYIVGNHLHHPHGDHCDNHGNLTASKN